jgi:hypothetical protein
LLTEAKALTHEIQQEREIISNLIATSTNLDDNELITAVKETFKEEVEITKVSKQELPESSPASSSNSYDPLAPYFSKPDKGKTIDLTNLSPSEIDRRGLSSNIAEAPIEQPAVEVPIQQPKSMFGSLLDQIKSRRNDTNIIDDTHKEIEVEVPEVTPEVPVEQPKTGISALLDQIKSFKKDSLFEPTNIVAEAPEVSQPKVSANITPDAPDIAITQADVTETEVKSGFTNLFENIKSKINSPVSPSPKISQVGLTSGQDSPQLLSPLKSKQSISNLFDDTAGLFDDGDEIEEVVSPSAPTNTPDNTQTAGGSSQAVLEEAETIPTDFEGYSSLS